MLEKEKKYVLNLFISIFTFTFTTAITILQIVNNGNVLTDGRNEKDYVRREQIC